MVKVSNAIAEPLLNNQSKYIYELLGEIHNKAIPKTIKLTDSGSESDNKVTKAITTLPREEVDNIQPRLIDSIREVKFSRTRNQSFTNGMVSVTKIKNNYIIGHFINADLSILEDFDDIKDYLDIVNNCIITLKKPMLIEDVNVYVRDTLLLAPGNNKSLAAIGELYGEDYKKITIDKE